VRILVNDYAGHPFQFELSSELAALGHDAHHAYCSTLLTPQTSFDAARVTVHEISTDRVFSKYDLRRRFVDELKYGWRSVKVARRVRPDRIVASNVPLVSLFVLVLWCSMTRPRLVLWLQDLQSGLVGNVAGDGTVARASRLLEAWLVRRAWRIVTISDEFREQVLVMGADPRRVVVIENWAPLDQLPERPRDNEWAKEHELTDRFVFLYSGTLGMKHSPELLLALAQEFDGDDRVRVVVVSEGVGTDWLTAELVARPVASLELKPFQPFERMPDVLGSADVLLALLEKDAAMYSVPSKTLTYLCGARPILAAMPSENAATRLVGARADAGIVVPPGDADAFVTAARSLLADPALRSRFARNAREYAVRTFDRAVVGQRFLDVLDVPPPLGSDHAGPASPGGSRARPAL
jgi:glycosyltransferase involved in cell wall biosynthesis